MEEKIKWLRGPSDAKIFLSNFFAHGGALIGGKLVGAPFDRLRLLAQTHPNAMQIWKEAYQNGGTRSFYRGAKSHIGSVLVALPLRLSFYRLTHQLHTDHKSASYRMVSHTAAAWLTLSVIYPLDVQYTLLACATQKSSPVSLFRQVWDRKLPVSMCYRGFSLCLLTSIPYLATSLSIHDYLHKRFLKEDSRPIQPSLEELTRGPRLHLYPINFICGISAGIIAQSIVYPLDTMRRRFICGSNYASWRECFHGRGLYNGVVVNMLKFIPEAGALCFGYYWVQEALKTT